MLGVAALMGHAGDANLHRVEALMGRLVADGAATADVLGPMAREHLATGGKRLRARLALRATHALRGDPEAGIVWAAACELAHNATLIHDDLQDGDRVRRGAPAAWVRHGVAQAINLGDLLLMLPFEAVQTVGIAAATLQAALAQHMAAVIRGQARELTQNSGASIGREAYLDMVRGKTAALFALPVHGAALLANRGDEAQAFASPFGMLGVVFQMQDDVVDLFGHKGRDAAGSDLREGKISALVVEHLARHPGDTEWLLGILRLPRQQTTTVDIDNITERFVAGGALGAVLREIERLSQAAHAGARPELRPLVDDLLARMLAPIAHLKA